ncbi:ROK family protein [Celerinatantimonas sp. MCCC 1A17872]|uniref:ROK family protein n=1 Tax=Celerinatantimonas sp. MCCC 1A17872 TaxID=3177514 RepID=UPI0038CB9A93
MDTKQVVNIDQVKQINMAAVYRLIDKLGPISRVQIAQSSQLAGASITKITRQLLEAGLIAEVSQQQSTGGRRATSLMSRPHFRLATVRLGRGILDLAMYDLTGQVHQKESHTLGAQTQEQLLPELIDYIGTFLEKQHKNKPIALALTLSGLVSPSNGFVIYAPYYELKQCPLGQILEQQFKLPTYVGNDTRAMALAEHYFGQSVDISDSVLVSVHHGTSAGIIIDGQVFMHRNRDLAEIGHIQVDPLGERCHCGNIGCLETICSNPALLARARKLLSQGSISKLKPTDSIEVLYQLAAQADELCEMLVRQAARALGKTLASVVNLLNPQVILISGEICLAQAIVFEEIHKSISHQALSSFAQQLEIRAAHYQNNPTVGGLALIKRAMLNGELLMQIIEQHSH